MSSKRLSMHRLFPALAIAGCLMTSLPLASLAQGLPGLTIFSGVERDNQLGYRLDFEGRPNARDRYHLRIPGSKLDLAVSQFVVTYPDTYSGTFDPDEIEVRIDGDSVPLDEVTWDEENRLIEIFPQDPVPSRTSVELVFEVRNPRYPGMHYFNALVRAPGDVLPPQYVGTWILSIGN